MRLSLGTRRGTAKDQSLHYKRFSASTAGSHPANQQLTVVARSESSKKRGLRTANSESWANSSRQALITMHGDQKVFGAGAPRREHCLHDGAVTRVIVGCDHDVAVRA